MNEPTLKFKKCYIVETWESEIKEAKGVIINFHSVWTSQSVLIKQGNTYMIKDVSKVFFDKESAILAAEKEKKDYMDYLKKEIKEKSEKLKSFES